VPNSVTSLNGTPTFEYYVVSCGSKNGYQKRRLFESEWIAYLRFDNHSRLNSHEHKNLHFDVGQDIHMSSKSYEESGYGLDLVLLIMCFVRIS
jgi:hypothetical protein